jgi:hypothetical protein
MRVMGHCRAKSILRCTATGLLLGAVVLSACTRRDDASSADGTVTTKAVSPGTTLGGPGTGPGRYTKPRAIDTDGQYLYVIDRSGRVQTIDPDTGRGVAYFNLPETKTGFPTGLTLGPSPLNDGTSALWIAETHMHRVTVYAPPPVDRTLKLIPPSEPRILARFGTYGHGPGQMVFPSGVELQLAPDGRTITRVYVTEFGGNDRVNILTPASAPDAHGRPTFTWVSSFGFSAAASEAKLTDAAFQRPQTVHLIPSRVASPAGPAQRLLVIDSVNHRLGLFDLDGALLRWIGTPPESTAGAEVFDGGQFVHPRGLTILPDQTALLVEFGANRVTHLDLQPMLIDPPGADRGVVPGVMQPATILARWGRAGHGVGELAEPWAIAVLGREGFIADARNHRLVRMDLPAPLRRPRLADTRSSATEKGGSR